MIWIHFIKTSVIVKCCLGGKKNQSICFFLCDNISSIVACHSFKSEAMRRVLAGLPDSISGWILKEWINTLWLFEIGCSCLIQFRQWHVVDCSSIILQPLWVHPMKYAYGFVVVYLAAIIFVWINLVHLPIFFRIVSMAMG